MKIIISLALISVNAFAKSPCDEFTLYGYPVVAFNSQVLCRTSYLQIHNNDTKTAGIAFEYLTPATIGSGNEPRTNNFRADIEVPRASRADPKEYIGSGFDKGHLAPAGDMQEDGKSMSQSFFMSNIAPQYPNHNRGIWKGLETVVRGWTVKQNRNLFVITGTVFARTPKCLPSGGPCIGGDVQIPKAFYKIIIDKENTDAVAFLIPHNKGSFKKLVDYRIGICDLEKATKQKLFPNATIMERQNLCQATGTTFKVKTK